PTRIDDHYLPRDPDAGVDTPDCQGHEQVGEDDHDDAHLDRATRCHTDTLGTTRGEEAVVALDERGDRDEHDRFEQRIEHVGRYQELVEVMHVGTAVGAADQ